MARFFLSNHHTKQIRRNRGKEDGIHTVENTTVTGNDIAAVLHTGLALEQGFREVAHQAENLNDEGKYDPPRHRYLCPLTE